jgi:CRISPR-associated endonuclease/helicase Cas3
VPEVPDWASSSAYPLITYSDGDEVYQAMPRADMSRSQVIQIRQISGQLDDICGLLEELLVEGGCIGIVVNTVARAQEIASTLSETFGENMVMLLHSGFIAIDRTKREAALLDLLGKEGSRPHKQIVVGTQVIEQSLDIDFDVMLTDICPIDLLIQRTGRLHRHERNIRPAMLSQPHCYVMGFDEFDSGSAAVYGEYLLLTTKYLLSNELRLPEDIPHLVHAAYGEGAIAPEDEAEAYANAKKVHMALVSDKETRSRSYRLRSPSGGKADLSGSLDKQASDTEAGGNAAVRDTESSIEVIVLQKIGDKHRMLPWVDDSELPTDRALEANLAFTLAGCKVKLPGALSKPWSIDSTIAELEKAGAELNSAWRESPWLNGELYLILDSSFSATICNRTGTYSIVYSKEYGLQVKGGDGL